MPNLFHRYATPLTTGLFLVSLISGIALFFHVGPSGFHGMHEWLSMVLILPFVLHLWRNWRAFTVYFRHAPMAIALALSVVAAAPFLIPSSQTGGGNPAFALVNRLADATPAELAAALHTTPEAVSAALAARGITAAALDQPLAPAMTASGKTAMDIAAALSTAGR